MKFSTAVYALVTLVPAVLAQQLMVDSPPNVVQCEPLLITWHNGQAPYFLSLIPGGQPSAPAMKQFGSQQGTSFNWKVDLASGASFTIAVTDNNGQNAYSAIETVNPGPDSSCLNSTVEETGSGSAGPSATVSGGSAAINTGAGTAAAASTSGAATAANVAPTNSVARVQATSSSATSSGTATKTTSASATASTGAASNSAARGSSNGALGLAGLLGFVGAALI